MRMGRTAAVVALAGLALAGCSPAREMATQSVRFETEPAGATVAVKGSGSCATPCALAMSQGEVHEAELSRDGCYSTSLLVNPVIDRTRYYAMFVDVFSGAAYELRPNPAKIKLVCGK